MSTIRRIATLAAVMAAISSPAGAQDALDPVGVSFGAVTFSFYCASCHGDGGKGDGEGAAHLSIAPADLTLLAQNNDDVFPTERVAAAIDGRAEVTGHVDVAMPPWGRLFAHELSEFPEGTVQNAMIKRRIDHLIAYLQSIQE